MLVIIEGIDRIGKSTLASKLAGRGFSSMHFSKPVGLDDGEKAHYQMGTFDRFFAFAKALEGSQAKIVCDRGHLGEAVYGPMYRPDSGVDTSYIYDMEKSYGPFEDVYLILLVHQDLDVVKARDDGLGFDISKLEDEQDMFISAFNRSNMTKKMTVDVTHIDAEVVFSIVSHILNI